MLEVSVPTQPAAHPYIWHLDQFVKNRPTIWELPTAATGVWAYAIGSSLLNLHALLKFEVFLATDQKVLHVEELLNPNMHVLFA